MPVNVPQLIAAPVDVFQVWKLLEQVGIIQLLQAVRWDVKIEQMVQALEPRGFELFDLIPAQIQMTQISGPNAQVEPFYDSPTFWRRSWLRFLGLNLSKLRLILKKDDLYSLKVYIVLHVL